MGLKLAHFTDSPAETVVIYSLLQSGGFHPFIFNYYHGFIAIAYVTAMDGFRIMLPEEEIEAAKKFVESTKPAPDFDPIQPQLKRDVLYASVLTQNPLFVLLLLPPYILILIIIFIIIFFIFIEPSLIIPNLTINCIPIYIVLMLAHAKYIALPAIRKTKETS